MKRKLAQFKQDIVKMSRVELLDLKLDIDSEIDDIKYQLKIAEGKVQTTGVYADPDWYFSAIRARNHHARKSQAIQIELKRKKGIKRESVNACFVEAARQRLDQYLFKQILAQAQELSELQKDIIQ